MRSADPKMTLTAVRKKLLRAIKRFLGFFIDIEYKIAEAKAARQAIQMTTVPIIAYSFYSMIKIINNHSWKYNTEAFLKVSQKEGFD
jgi:hypothetical protein